jgi:hypothetical protein
MTIKRPSINARMDDYDPSDPAFWVLDTVAEVDYGFARFANLPYPVKVVWRNQMRWTVVVARCDAYPLLWVVPWVRFRLRESSVLTEAWLCYLLQVWFDVPINTGERPSLKAMLGRLG